MATFLIAQTGNRLAPAIYLTVIAVGALVAIRLMPETNRRVMDDTASMPVLGQEGQRTVAPAPPGPPRRPR